MDFHWGSDCHFALRGGVLFFRFIVRHVGAVSFTGVLSEEKQAQSLRHVLVN